MKVQTVYQPGDFIYTEGVDGTPAVFFVNCNGDLTRQSDSKFVPETSAGIQAARGKATVAEALNVAADRVGSYMRYRGFDTITIETVCSAIMKSTDSRMGNGMLNR